MTSASVVGHTIKSIVGVKTHYFGDSPLRPFWQDRSLVGILNDVAILFCSRFLFGVSVMISHSIKYYMLCV